MSVSLENNEPPPSLKDLMFDFQNKADKWQSDLEETVKLGNILIEFMALPLPAGGARSVADLIVEYFPSSGEYDDDDDSLEHYMIDCVCHGRLPPSIPFCKWFCEIGANLVYENDSGAVWSEGYGTWMLFLHCMSRIEAGPQTQKQIIEIVKNFAHPPSGRQNLQASVDVFINQLGFMWLAKQYDMLYDQARQKDAKKRK